MCLHSIKQLKGNLLKYFCLSSITDVHKYTLIRNLMPATYFKVSHDISLYFGALKNNESQTDHKNNNWIYSRKNVWEKWLVLFFLLRIFSVTVVPFANIYIFCNHSWHVFASLLWRSHVERVIQLAGRACTDHIAWPWVFKFWRWAVCTQPVDCSSSSYISNLGNVMVLIVVVFIRCFWKCS